MTDILHTRRFASTGPNLQTLPRVGFDIDLAIAAMPQNNGQHPEELLRGRYPELAFLFDEVAGLRELIASHDESTYKQDAAYDDGHSTGHDEGYADGHRIGYDTGYADGASAATE